jgi:hypothetical protein
MCERPVFREGKTCSHACANAYKKAYRTTDKCKAYHKAYNKTDKCKAYQKAYQKTDKYKAYYKAYKKAYYLRNKQVKKKRLGGSYGKEEIRIIKEPKQAHKIA